MMLRLEVVLGRMLWSCLVVAEPKNSMFQFTEIIGFLGRYLVEMGGVEPPSVSPLPLALHV